MDKKSVYIIIMALSFICFILSIWILVEKTSVEPSLRGVCNALSPGSQCDVVQQSSYGKILGIDNPWFGIFGFSIIIIFCVMQLIYQMLWRRILISVGAICSGLMALWLLYVQAFILHAFCIFCIFVDLSSIIVMVSGIYLIFARK